MTDGARLTATAARTMFACFRVAVLMTCSRERLSFDTALPLVILCFRLIRGMRMPNCCATSDKRDYTLVLQAMA